MDMPVSYRCPGCFRLFNLAQKYPEAKFCPFCGCNNIREVYPDENEDSDLEEDE